MTFFLLILFKMCREFCFPFRAILETWIFTHLLSVVVFATPFHHEETLLPLGCLCHTLSKIAGFQQSVWPHHFEGPTWQQKRAIESLVTFVLVRERQVPTYQVSSGQYLITLDQCSCTFEIKRKERTMFLLILDTWFYKHMKSSSHWMLHFLLSEG